MDDLEGYLRQGEPGQAEKAQAWRMAIGLQRMDGLKPSAYLIETAKQHIEGLITIKEAIRRLDRYHAQLKKNREMHVHHVDPAKSNDPVSDTEKALSDKAKGGRDPVNDPVKRSILQQLKLTPRANYDALAERTGYSTATIKRHIQELKRSGLIERIGSDKTGHWKVIDP